MKGWRPDKAERKERSKTEAFAQGYDRGTQATKNRIIEGLLKDAVVTTNVNIDVLERIVEIVES
jgi:hypothetical protein